MKASSSKGERWVERVWCVCVSIPLPLPLYLLEGATLRSQLFSAEPTLGASEGAPRGKVEAVGPMGLVGCNTRFIKGHKPSNHIRARIKSHIYTIEWIVYHVKRYNKVNTNVIYYNNDKKCLIQRKRSTNTIKTLRSWAGRHRDVDWETKRLEVLVVLVALSELPRVGRNWAAVEYPQKVKKVE